MTWTLRAATPADVGEIFRLIKALADYEKLSDEVTGSVDALREDLFGARRYAEVIMAEAEGRTAGFALFLHDYSTFKTRPGIWVEDIFVEPELRGRGIGTALLARIARIAVERGCARLEWTVLDWNTPAIRFYEGHGAEVLPDWRVCRVSGAALERLARS